MYKDKKILAIIPARGGSKGIPRKNIVDLCGKPLIGYTISAALESEYIDYVMVSTDDQEIAEISESLGADVPFLRPPELAKDTSKTVDAIVHALETLKEQGKNFDILVLLQPTQPLRDAADIDMAINVFFDKGCLSLASVCPVDDHPILIRSIDDDKLIPLLDVSSTCRRQDMPRFYKVNGCIYINQIATITKDTSFNDNEIPFVMEKMHSVDIDEYHDLMYAEYCLKALK